MKQIIFEVLAVLATAVSVVAVSLFFVFVAIEWLSGCGETYVDSQGVRHEYECQFIRR